MRRAKGGYTMFETATISYGPPSKRVWTTFAGVTGQALLLTCAVLAPLISPQALPRAAWSTKITAPGPPAAPPGPGPGVRPKTAAAAASQFFRKTLIAPSTIPPRAQLIEDEPAVAGAGNVTGVPGGDPNGVPGGLLNSIISDHASIAPAVKPPEPVVNTAPKTAAAPKPPRISVVEMARPIHRVDPIYPPLAKQMRIAGVVELQGLLGTDGRIHELKVLSGHPLLVRAAVDAVSQWTYAPTILNGQPVEVVAPITVTFKMTQ